MAKAFASRVLRAAMTLLCVSREPVDLAHKATSSIAAAIACWLCNTKVSTSVAAMLASILSGMVVILARVATEWRLPGLSNTQGYLVALFGFVAPDGVSDFLRAGLRRGRQTTMLMLLPFADFIGKLLDQFNNVTSKHIAQVVNLDDVQSSNPSFNVAYEGLWASQRG